MFAGTAPPVEWHSTVGAGVPLDEVLKVTAAEHWPLSAFWLMLPGQVIVAGSVTLNDAVAGAELRPVLSVTTNRNSYEPATSGLKVGFASLAELSTALLPGGRVEIDQA